MKELCVFGNGGGSTGFRPSGGERLCCICQGPRAGLSKGEVAARYRTMKHLRRPYLDQALNIFSAMPELHDELLAR